MRDDRGTQRAAQAGRTGLLGLFIASFLFAFQDSASSLALPWRVMSLGGQTRDVGLVGALALMTYLVFCFMTGTVTKRIGVKRAVLISLSLTCVALLLMPMVPGLVILFGLVACKGMVMSAFWPPVMGWVSTGSEGGSLNKRIGIFNFSWSAGSIVGCYLGGTLFQVAEWLPFVTAAGAAALAIIAISIVPRPHASGDAAHVAEEEAQEPARLVMFRWIWRVGFVAAWVALGALRFPIAALIKEMHRGAETHALLSAGMNVVCMFSFFLLSRTMLWHYKFRFILLAQSLLIAMLIGVAMSRTPGELITFALISMIALSFAYFSHLYYAVTGSRHRQRGAATHEIILSVGISIGSFGGGAMGQWCGIRPVFLMIAGIMGAALVVQGCIFALGKLGWFGAQEPSPHEPVTVSA